MSYPKYVPASIVEWLNEHRNTSQAQTPGADPLKIVEIWHRLATRPEMEVVWHFISRFDRAPFLPLVANGGLLGTINRRLIAYHFAPKLSPTDYRDEMSEIARMAAALAAKLKRFSDADVGCYNPFPPQVLLGKVAKAVDEHLPAIDAQLIVLANRAKVESVDQMHRLPLPRKVNDKNTLRTYFVRIVADHFFMMYADYSPSRIAIFCSVALDDPDITPDLIRKLYLIDDEQKTMLRENVARR